MTPEQKAALKTYIQAQQDIGPMFADGNLSGVADALNAEASPTSVVWRTWVDVAEIRNNGFAYAALDNAGMTNSKYRIWQELSSNVGGPNNTNGFNPSKPNVRQGLSDAFSWSTAMTNGIAPHLRRNATRFEQVFLPGTGTTNSPQTLVLEGPLAWQELIGL